MKRGMTLPVVVILNAFCCVQLYILPRSFLSNSLFKMLNKSQRFKSKIIVTQGYVSGQGERKSVVI